MGPLERGYLGGVRFTELQTPEPVFRDIWMERQRQPRLIPGVPEFRLPKLKLQPGIRPERLQDDIQ